MLVELMSCRSRNLPSVLASYETWTITAAGKHELLFSYIKLPTCWMMTQIALDSCVENDGFTRVNRHYSNNLACRGRSLENAQRFLYASSPCLVVTLEALRIG